MLRPAAVPRATADSTSVTSDAASSSIVACGITSHVVDTLPPHGSAEVSISLLPLSQGVQQLSGVLLQGSSDGRIYDRMQPLEVHVNA